MLVWRIGLPHNVPVTVIIGVDGSGRTHRLDAIADASARSVVRINPADTVEEVRVRLQAAREDDSLVVADDAHRLSDDVLRTLADTAQRGVRMVITRRPTLDREPLAALDQAVLGAHGDVESLEPLVEAELSVLIRAVRGRSPERAETERILVESGGLPAIASAMASVEHDGAAPALVARIQQRLALAGGSATRLCRVLALGLDLSDAVLCQATGTERDELTATFRELRDAGLIGADGHRLVPAVAAAVKAELSPAELRRVHSDVADALLDSGAEPLAAAAQLRAARVRSPAAAEVFGRAGDQLRLTDPDEALAWYDDAADAGAETVTLAEGRAEAAALLGRPVDLDTGTSDRLALVAGAVEAHHGRSGRAVDALLPAGPAGRLLAVPMLVSLGRMEQAAEIVKAGEAPLALRRVAEAAIAITDPAHCVPLFIEAAEVIERAAPALVLPDTPHALGAIVAVNACDAATAERLLTAALAAGIGGPVAADRHRLLLGWARMRAGRYDTAQAELRRTDGQPLPGRERLLRASLAAGIARRSGDVATLRSAWEQAEPALVRGAVDLSQLECVEELVVAAARLGRPRRADPVLAALETIVERLGGPPAWAGALSWIHVQCAVANDDADAVRRAASGIAGGASTAGRVGACAAAAASWADVLDGIVDRTAVLAAADELDAAELPWEASRLAGQAATRTTDPDDARHLLERARAFTHQQGEVGDEQRPGRLSDREVEVARLVLAGRTHKEIGGQLYLSPKTVEHHVARIRSKLGVRTRAELVAALREVLEDQPHSS